MNFINKMFKPEPVPPNKDVVIHKSPLPVQKQVDQPIVKNDHGYDRKKIELIKTQLMPPGCSNEELDLFMHVVKRRGLDPMDRQIYAIVRGKGERRKLSFETSIDGARLIAQRSGKYRGQLGPFWCGQDGEWKDIWLGGKPLYAAKVGILHSEFTEPLWAVAIHKDYKPSPPMDFIWNKFPSLMTAKVAEMLALRKAFPNDLGGLYSREEMQQVDCKPKQTESIPQSTPVQHKQISSQKPKVEKAPLKPIDEIKIILFKITEKFKNAEKCSKVMQELGIIEWSELNEKSDETLREMINALEKTKL